MLSSTVQSSESSGEVGWKMELRVPTPGYPSIKSYKPYAPCKEAIVQTVLDKDIKADM